MGKRALLRRGATGIAALGLVVAPLLTGAPTPAGAEVVHRVVVMDGGCAPSNLDIRVGERVVWTFDVAEPQSLTPVDRSSFAASPPLAEGTFSVVFDEVGTHDYWCSRHVGHRDLRNEAVVRVHPADAVLPPQPRPPLLESVPRAGDRIGAAVSWAQRMPVGATPTVLLAREDVFADAIASGGAQGALDAPLLLTQGAPAARLDDRVVATLDRLGAETVLVLGGPRAISDGVVAQLRDELGLDVERVRGSDRIATAVAIARRVTPDATEAVLARAFETDDPTQAWADTIPAGGAAASRAMPVLLSETSRLSPVVRDHLAASAVTRVYVVGGPRALAPRVVEDLEGLGIEAIRLAGRDRFATSVAVAERFQGAPAPSVLLLGGTHPDDWAAGAAAAVHAESSPIVLVRGDGVEPHLEEALVRGDVTVVCGPRTGSGGPGDACWAAREVVTPYAGHPSAGSAVWSPLVDAEGGPMGVVFLAPSWRADGSVEGQRPLVCGFAVLTDEGAWSTDLLDVHRRDDGAPAHEDDEVGHADAAALGWFPGRRECGTTATLADRDGIFMEPERHVVQTHSWSPGRAAGSGAVLRNDEVLVGIVRADGRPATTIDLRHGLDGEVCAVVTWEADRTHEPRPKEVRAWYRHQRGDVPLAVLPIGTGPLAVACVPLEDGLRRSLDEYVLEVGWSDGRTTPVEGVVSRVPANNR